MTLEREFGIEGYLTTVPGIGGRLKALPEDFVVVEVGIDLPRSEDGHCLLTEVTSRNWETNRLIRELSRALRISRRRVSFAGTKDKRAVTTQRMTLQNVHTEDLARVRLKDVELKPLYRTNRGLKLGDLYGNRFQVRLTEVRVEQQMASSRLKSLVHELTEAGGFPNFFGPQRFGEIRPITHLVGRALVKGDLAGAVELYLGHPQPGEQGNAYEARMAFQETGDVPRALREFPGRLGFERAILNHLRKRPGDFKGGLSQLPQNLLTLFVNAYQAFLFNRILSLRLQRFGLREALVGDLVLPLGRTGLPKRDSPVMVSTSNIEKVQSNVEAGKTWISGLIVGYEAPLAEGEMGRLEREIVEEEEVDPKDFVLPEMPHLSSRGQRRELLSPIRELAYQVDDDVHLSFGLHPGCYATALLREIMKGESA